MRKIDYKDWSEYLLALFRNFGVSDEKVLELGGGNGIIASHLSKYFPEVYLTDLSKEMLLKSKGSNLLRVCCDMRNIPFKKEFGLIYSTFDSVNYMLTLKDLRKMFDSVYSVCGEDTIFTFDASLEKNSKKYEKQLNRQGKYKGINFVQKSRYDEKKRLHYNCFELLMPDGATLTETHIQKIYKFETFFKIIDDTGFYVVDCFDAFSFDKAGENSLRAQFIVKKQR